MLGGLIAGALGGGASAASSIADRVLKEADEAKKRAEQMGLINLQRQWTLEDKESDRKFQTERDQDNKDFQLGATVLQSQLADERQVKQNEFTAAENQKNRDAQVKIANIGASSRAKEDPFAGFDPKTKNELKSLYERLQNVQKKVDTSTDPIEKQELAASAKTLTSQYVMTQQKGLIKAGKVNAVDAGTELATLDAATAQQQLKFYSSIDPAFGRTATTAYESSLASQKKPAAVQTPAAPVQMPQSRGTPITDILTGRAKGTISQENDVTDIMSRY